MSTIGSPKLLRSRTIAALSLAIAALSAPAIANASPSSASTNSAPSAGDIVTACPNETYRTTGANGTPLDSVRLDRIRQTVENLCRNPQRTSTVHPQMGTYTQIHITNDPGLLSVNTTAVGLYYNFATSSPRNELSQVVRFGTDGPWQDAGYGAGTTSVTTSLWQICPAPGQVFQATSSLYIDGVESDSDFAEVVTAG